MYVVDRFEGKIAVCEDLEAGGIVEILGEELKGKVREGDVIVKLEGEYVVDIVETAARRRRIHDKMKKLWQKS